MYQEQLEQLLGMGAARARARAALLKTKGDLMEAAELVFAGEFDELPSDDDETVPRVSQTDGERPTGLATPAKTPELIQDSEDEYNGLDDDEIYDDVGEADDAFDMDLGDDAAEPGSGCDPYAGIFFSKDRVETITEIQDYPIKASIPLPPGAPGVKTSSGKVPVVSLTRGEWMSGCPEGNEQSFLFQLYDILSQESYKCPYHCGAEIKRKQLDFFIIFNDFATYMAHLKNIIQTPCPSCQMKSCLACGERADDTRAKHALSGQPEDAELYHCSNLQGVILGVALNMVERLFEEQTSKRKSRKDSEPANKKRKVGDLQSGYDGYAMNSAAKGTGYSGSATEDMSGQRAAQAAQQANDLALVQTLSAVRNYLPCLNRLGGPMTSDYMVHPTSLAHLRRRSNFVNTLLRNDSLLDMSSRNELYTELFEWLEVVSNHEALASMLAMPQMRPTGVQPPRLEAVPAEAAGKLEPVSYTITYEGAPSPRELLESIVIQAHAAIKGLSSTTQIPEQPDAVTAEERLRMNAKELAAIHKEAAQETIAEENVALRTFCVRIINTAASIDRALRETKGDAYVDRLIAALPKVPGSGPGLTARVEAGATDEETIRTYVDWATHVRFRYCDLSFEEQPDKWRHAFSAELLGIANANAPKRSLAIAKELAMLTTNLPVAWHSSVFLRVDETRVDCIKALIIGPEGTPYENGCFLFDIFLPVNYNSVPPKVKTMTTNGGRYRFNPNLYAEGKVCLSLLGTWSGPGWIAGQSTLLQVLISIQSLIMTNEPYLNEPGWAAQAGTSASKQYSGNIARMTVHEAMVNSIKSPPYPFKEEVHTHFRLKANYIRKQMERWIEDDNGKGVNGDAFSYTNTTSTTNAAADKTFLQQQVETLEDLLQKLEAGEDPSAGPKTSSEVTTTANDSTADLEV